MCTIVSSPKQDRLKLETQVGTGNMALSHLGKAFEGPENLEHGPEKEPVGSG